MIINSCASYIAMDLDVFNLDQYRDILWLREFFRRVECVN